MDTEIARHYAIYIQDMEKIVCLSTNNVICLVYYAGLHFTELFVKNRFR